MSPLGNDGSHGGAAATVPSAAPPGSAGCSWGTPLGPSCCQMILSIIRHHSTAIGDNRLPFVPHEEGHGEPKRLAAAVPSAAPVGSTGGCMGNQLAPSRCQTMSGIARHHLTAIWDGWTHSAPHEVGREPKRLGWCSSPASPCPPPAPNQLPQ